MPKEVKILDCTLRDGSYAIDFQFSAQNTFEICQALSKAGFEYIEVGHGFGLGATEAGKGRAKESDQAYIEAAKQGSLNKAKVGMFFIPGIGQKEHLKLAKENGLDFVRIGLNADQILNAKDYVDYAGELGLEIHLNLMKTYTLNNQEFLDKIKKMKHWNLQFLTVVDSAGCMLPQEVQDYIEILKDHLSFKIGFHGHNNLQLAVANALGAIEGGCDIIDTCLMGMGRSAGNTQTEIMVLLFNKLGIPHNIDVFAAMDAGKNLVMPLMKNPQGVNDIDAAAGFAKFHSSFLGLLQKAAQTYNVDLRKLIINVCQKDIISPSQEIVNEEANKLANQ
ncbi:MAG: 4-hydroxy-2-oxovalerate aldolase [Candidatus Pacebacteria bacterium]|nr:4-hydroxy-2-oxovalerate aldolase [Candidatus Paceibacterota bacterium]